MAVDKARALRVKMGRFVRFMLLASVFILTVLSFYISVQQTARAEQLSWTGDVNPSIASAKDAPIESNDCVFRQSISVVGEATQKDVCLTEGGSFQFGTYFNGNSNIPVVRTAYDNNMYKLRDVCWLKCLYLPSKDMLVTKQNSPNASVENLVIYKDFSSRLTRTINEETLITEYRFNNTEPDYVFKNTDTDYAWPVGGMNISDNENWLVFEARERSMMLLNTDDLSVKRISMQEYRYGRGNDPAMEFAVSNDGQSVAMMGRNTRPLIFDVSDACGDQPTNDQMQDSRPIPNPCPSKDLNTFSDQFIDHFSEGYSPSFNIDGGELSFYATSYSAQSRFVLLRAEGYQVRTLDYLALGDSYSSGEGDTAQTSDGQKYYLSHTDVDGDYQNNVPREKCHQSVRAYPFLLADSMRLSDDKKETVACSGATIGDIAGGKREYKGQYNGGDPNKPRLQDIQNIAELQTISLQDFIPGRVRQIEFVERYKPRAVTVGISGNDVKFGDVVRSCTIDTLGDTCIYADGAQGTASLGKLIATQYNSLVTLYTRLHEAWPETKIYTIGYPKFVSTGDNCGNNVQLDGSEREMAEQATEYLNEIIKQAAQRAGVRYIDIEDSLNGRRLCDTTKPYVTGLAAWMKSENQESFHPNAQGNELMVNMIISQLAPDNLLTHRNCPLPMILDFCPNSSISPPKPTSYFADAMNSYNRSVRSEQLMNDKVNKTNPQKVESAPFSLQPNSTVNIVLHSEPVSLGDYTVTENGSFSQEVIIPSNLPVGYHTLHVYGNSYSGEPINLTQIIEVRGAEGDIDEDKIADNLDPCLYILAANIDHDYDGIDDACDPEIEDIQPYQVRNGDTRKGEKTDHIFIERNVRASPFTGITGDYDPDSDGWAIVAASKGENDSGTPTSFWVDNDKIPHVSIRTDDKDCVQFTPLSLKVVKSNKIRPLKREAGNSNICRFE